MGDTYIAKNSLVGVLSISTLVRECAVRWNSIEASLMLFYRKMLDLGFTFDGRDVVCPNNHLKAQTRCLSARVVPGTTACCADAAKAVVPE